MWSCPRSPSTAMRPSMTAADTASIRVRNMTRRPVFRIPYRKIEIRTGHLYLLAVSMWKNKEPIYFMLPQSESAVVFSSMLLPFLGEYLYFRCGRHRKANDRKRYGERFNLHVKQRGNKATERDSFVNSRRQKFL